MDASEVETAWAEVQARWADEAAHAALLTRFCDLEGLAEVGRRYREVLAARPEDATALRWRDEIVRRAAVVALSQLPRTAPPRQLSPGLRRTLLLTVAALSTGAVAWIFLRLAQAPPRAP